MEKRHWVACHCFFAIKFSIFGRIWEAETRKQLSGLSSSSWSLDLPFFTFIFEKNCSQIYEGVSKSFRTGHLERELQMVGLSTTRCTSIAILWVSIVSFAAITLCVASQRVFIVVSVYFEIYSVRKLLDTTSYVLPRRLFIRRSCYWALQVYQQVNIKESNVSKCISLHLKFG
jgi:hypothetical protein